MQTRFDGASKWGPQVLRSEGLGPQRLCELCTHTLCGAALYFLLFCIPDYTRTFEPTDVSPFDAGGLSIIILDEPAQLRHCKGDMPLLTFVSVLDAVGSKDGSACLRLEIHPLHEGLDPLFKTIRRSP